jgi:hypothetical protein
MSKREVLKWLKENKDEMRKWVWGGISIKWKWGKQWKWLSWRGGVTFKRRDARKWERERERERERDRQREREKERERERKCFIVLLGYTNWLRSHLFHSFAVLGDYPSFKLDAFEFPAFRENFEELFCPF